MVSLMRTLFDHNSIAKSLTRWMIQVSYPCTCPVCGAVMDDETRAWCEACDSGVIRLPGPLCAVCHRYVAASRAGCPSSHPPASPSILVALGLFDQAWRAIVHALKYQGHKSLAQPLGQMLAESVAKLPDIDAIVSVPTDPRKIGERGFGHAELLGETLAAESGIAFISGGMTLTRRLTDQTRLTGKQRAQNLKGAFQVPDPEIVNGKTIVVIDDVTTTGATLREAARALTVAGAESVAGAVIAANLANLRDGR